jgi:hypothetical protein
MKIKRTGKEGARESREWTRIKISGGIRFGLADTGTLSCGFQLQGFTGCPSTRSAGTIQTTSRELPEFPRISEEKNRSD